MVKTGFTLHYILLQVSFGFSAKAQNNNGSAVHNTMALGKQTNLDNIYLERLKTFHTHLHTYAETLSNNVKLTQNIKSLIN